MPVSNFSLHLSAVIPAVDSTVCKGHTVSWTTKQFRIKNNPGKEPAFNLDQPQLHDPTISCSIRTESIFGEEMCNERQQPARSACVGTASKTGDETTL